MSARLWPDGGSHGLAVLFDVDGTLVDTNYLHTLAWSRALADVGEWAPMNAIHRLIGMGGEQLVPRLLGHANEAAVAARPRRFQELIGEVRAFPGARELLSTLAERGAQVLLATSSPRQELDAMVGLLDAGDAISHMTSADDVDRAKPHADVFERALELAGVGPDDAVAVGDSVWDIEAGHRAGLRVVTVETGGFSEAELRHAGADDVYHDVAELLAAVVAEPAIATGGRHLTGARQAAENAAVDPPA
jgi:HAD superfamily hydrolase (TIGR01509 family)